jgi:hypothetical protein
MTATVRPAQIRRSEASCASSTCHRPRWAPTRCGSRSRPAASATATTRTSRHRAAVSAGDAISPRAGDGVDAPRWINAPQSAVPP